MEIDNKIILDSFESPFFIRRRKLLPWWIKMFCWIFMIAGVLVPIGCILGTMGLSTDLNLYGLKTTHPFSLIGIVLLLLFSLKAVAGYGLWYEKDWAIIVGKADAGIGIALCLLLTFISPGADENTGIFFRYTFTLRLEFIVLIPYLIKIAVLKNAWQQSGNAS